MHAPKRTKVLTEEEWINAIRGIVQRDFFPLPNSSHSCASSNSLDHFLSHHTSEDNLSFQETLLHEQQAFQIKMNPESRILKLIQDQRNQQELLLTDCFPQPHNQQQQQQQRQINLGAIQALSSSSPSSSTLVSSKRITEEELRLRKRKLPAAAAVLSQPAKDLVSKLRKRKKLED